MEKDLFSLFRPAYNKVRGIFSVPALVTPYKLPESFEEWENLIKKGDAKMGDLKQFLDAASQKIETLINQEVEVLWGAGEYQAQAIAEAKADLAGTVKAKYATVIEILQDGYASLPAEPVENITEDVGE